MPPPPAIAPPVPLCVDLDGTLIKTDMMWETLVRLLQKNPLYFFSALGWWTRGRAFLKQELARRATVAGATLPYHEKFLAWLREEKKSGRKLLLVTASDLKMAQPAAAHTGLFDEVLASDGKINLRHENKRRTLVEKFGERGFDYAGNSRDDLAVWRSARAAIVVNASPAVAKRAAAETNVAQVFVPEAAQPGAFFRSLRPQRWLKNLIVLVPALVGNKLADITVLERGALAFLAFCFCASSVYATNDLVDLDADRRHAEKKRRPFASGDLPLPVGLLLAPLLLVLGLATATELSRQFLALTAGYLLLAAIYSRWLKRVVLLDVISLAGLYTVRLIAGSAATDSVVSAWLLVFSIFIFLSLALVQRRAAGHSNKK